MITVAAFMNLIIILLVIALLIGLVHYAVQAIPIADPLGRIIKVVAVIIGILAVIVALLNMVGAVHIT